MAKTNLDGLSAVSIQVGSQGTGIGGMAVYLTTVDPTSIALSATTQTTVTLSGLSTTDVCYVNIASLPADVVIANSRVSATDQLVVGLFNGGATSANPGPAAWRVVAIRG